jgi:hypothetical protein
MSPRSPSICYALVIQDMMSYCWSNLALTALIIAARSSLEALHLLD